MFVYEGIAILVPDSVKYIKDLEYGSVLHAHPTLPNNIEVFLPALFFFLVR